MVEEFAAVQRLKHLAVVDSFAFPSGNVADHGLICGVDQPNNVGMPSKGTQNL